MAILNGNNSGNILWGTNNSDTINGNGGADLLFGRNGDDLINGGNGNDIISGDSGNDTLNGDQGADLISGGSGDDQINGGDGNDALLGDSGNDTLIGGLGADILTGGSGSDIFKYLSASESLAPNRDWILDFKQGADKIDLTGLGLVWSGSPALNGVWYEKVSGIDYVKANINGADFQIRVSGLGGASINADDFIGLGSGGGNLAPTDITLTGAVVNENVPAGTVIGTLSATDPNGGDTFTYTLATGDGTNDADNGLVQIVGNQLQAKAGIDFETNPSLEIFVQVQDAGGLIYTKALTVTVDNVDEVAPSFTSATTGNATENQNVLHTAAATDAVDFTDGVVTYSLKGDGSGDDAELLDIDSTTGAVTLKTDNLDYEGKGTYTFTVIAADATGNENERTVTVTVDNVDEVAPSFTSATTGNATENQNLLHTAAATDAVDFTDGVVTYSLKGDGSGDDAELLDIDSTTGAVTLKTGNLDYEGKGTYTFTVIAADATGNENERTVTVTVDNVDEVAPSFTSVTTGNATENQNLLHTAAATDAVDFTDGVVTYSLKGDGSGDDAELLDIDSTTGAVTLKTGNLDYEGKGTYTFTVIAADATGNENERTVTVTVDNVDEVAPSFTSATTGNATENQNLLHTAAATDAVDFTDGVVTYSLKGDGSGDDAELLDIDSTTGAVTLKTGNLDYEGKGTYTFTVIAADATGNENERTVTVTVDNVDEVAPSFTSATTGNATENQNVLHTAAATDAVDFTDGVVTYSLKGDGSGDDAELLDIDSTTGAVTLKTDNLDYEGKGTYTFTVIAADATGNENERTVTVTVDNVDEVAPSFTSATTGNATENQNLLHTAAATDAVDFTDGVVTYSLKGDGSGDDAELLDIDSTTGAVTLKTGNLDYEGKGTYTFTVIAADATGNENERTVTVTVDNVDEVAPSFTSATTGNATENQNLLHTAAATDAVDFTDGVVTYSLKGDGSGDDAELLDIDSTTGAVTLKTGNLDYEGKGTYTFTVIAADATGNENERTVTVTVDNVDEVAPSFTSATTGNATENQNVLHTAAATDAVDFTDGVVTYSLKGDGSGDDAELLDIDSTTGAVTLKTGNLDYEGKNSYTFTVIAADATGNTSERTVTVTVGNVDEVAPAFTSGTTDTATENQNLLHTAVATDAVDYTNGVVSYSLKGDGSSDDAELLDIDSSSGAVTLKTGNLDYEGKNSYTFTVIAADATGNTSERTVTVTVGNVDEVAPAFTSGTTDTATENQNLLHTAVATDAVDYTNGVVSYSLKGDGSSDDAELLDIDSSSGAVTLKTGNLDYEGKNSYTFTVIAADATGNTSERTVTVTVDNVVENTAPVLVAETVYTNVQSGSSISIQDAWLLRNDTDVDLDTLSVTAASGNSPATASHSGSIVTLTPNINSGNSTSFNYSISDGTSTTASPPADIVIRGSNNAVITASANDDILISTRTNTAMTGGNGFDVFSLESGASSGNTIADLGLGGDALVLASGSSVTATVNSAGFTATSMTQNNGGTATLNSAGYTVNLSAATGSAGYTITGSTSTAMNLTGSDFNDSITGGTGADTISGGAGNDTLTGGTGADNLNGDAGNDRFSYVSVGDLFSSNVIVDNISGGADDDSIVINQTTAWTIAAADSFATRITGVENIVAGAANANVISVTLNDNAYEAGIRKVDLSADTNALGSNVISAAAETGASNGYTLIGSAGGDTITGGAGADTITGGLGADVMDAGTGLDTLVVAAGDTALTIGGSGNSGTISGFDTVSNLAAGTASVNSETLDTVGTATVVANGAVNGTNSTLTIASQTVKSHSVSSGIITFDDADTYTSALGINSEGRLAAVVQYLQLQDLGNAGATVAFDYGSDTYVYTQGSDSGTDNSLDVLVKLVGVQADSLKTTNGTGADDLFIA